MNIIRKTHQLMGMPILFINKLGHTKKCYICQHTFTHFHRFRRGTKDLSDYLKSMQIIGSDLDNYRCIYCGAVDRERHLFMFFDKLGFWANMENSNILHIAPELYLSEKIENQTPKMYVKGDLYPSKYENTKRIDITDIHFSENTFDFVICNHVLEHVLDYMQALKEIYRVLKIGGNAILQTPYSNLLVKNFEDSAIISEAQRDCFYGQSDHVRIFSKEQFLKDLVAVGFVLHIVKNNIYFNNDVSKYYGINCDEDLIYVTK